MPLRFKSLLIVHSNSRLTVYSYVFFEKAVECDFWSVFLKAQVATGSRTRLTNERCSLWLYIDCYSLPCGAATRRRAVGAVPLRAKCPKCVFRKKTCASLGLDAYLYMCFQNLISRCIAFPDECCIANSRVGLIF